MEDVVGTDPEAVAETETAETNPEVVAETESETVLPPHVLDDLLQEFEPGTSHIVSQLILLFFPELRNV